MGSLFIRIDQIKPIKDEFLGGDEKTSIYNIYGEEQIKLDKKANEIYKS